jgi:hypothetical protein
MARFSLSDRRLNQELSAVTQQPTFVDQNRIGEPRLIVKSFVRES